MTAIDLLLFSSFDFHRSSFSFIRFVGSSLTLLYGCYYFPSISLMTMSMSKPMIMLPLLPLLPILDAAVRRAYLTAGGWSTIRSLSFKSFDSDTGDDDNDNSIDASCGMVL